MTPELVLDRGQILAGLSVESPQQGIQLGTEVDRQRVAPDDERSGVRLHLVQYDELAKESLRSPVEEHDDERCTTNQLVGDGAPERIFPFRAWLSSHVT